MKYELAKELKDAGWDMHHAGAGYLEIGGVTPSGYFDNWPPSVCAVPTLSELIEACGAFDRLEATTGFSKSLDYAGEFWTATAFKNGQLYNADGHTHIQAVARLWLALNKKI